MHMPRFLIVLSIAVLALASTATASAGVADREPAATGAQLSLVGGKGTAVVTSEVGTILGTMKQGTITLVDFARGAKTKYDARKWNCTKRKRLDRRTVRCTGKDLWFSIAGGAWMVTLHGRGIAASAVVDGKVKLSGTRGTFSIDGGKSRKWPLVARTFKLS